MDAATLIGSQPSKLTSVKALAESLHLSSIPSSYTFPKHANDEAYSGTTESIPIIDFSLLTSSNPVERSKMIQELGNACQDWGFFMVTNHGVPESTMKAMIEACRQFFELTEEEKGEYEGKHVLDPIRSGTSFNASVEKVLYWRDYLKIFQHPQFHSPNNPPAFRKLHRKGRKSGKQPSIMIANLYPPCPQPELAMGLPAHSDHGLVTLLIQNEIGGLQVQHNGKWVNIHPLPNSFLANIGDHVEYKSVLHRAVVNNKHVRISIALSNGPALDAAVSPASKFLEDGWSPPAYGAMTYREYVELQQSNKLDGKSCLERIRNS
ncbi:putative 2-oxoglutarate and Fe(II)-dependent oxygenase superfamily protein [Hibiscus syriacus]|uniref:2-oxoglutarate and Fe(II)-dependent oxygenase superfamily protein n=1 Tax=Hibiscus syriacus TaxID=106335 RepID=A0A6A2Z8E0_HIBSY|nr:putative 2-oxoglutarate and Fe(II)-dependent oxygenase superfamily protein [Hibiscus syriacus]